MTKSIELGCAGHSICSDRCRWHRHTIVGNYAVSSVGDLFINKKRETFGAGSEDWFETMVFPLTDRKFRNNDGCGCREFANYSELEGIRYKTAGEAQAGHEKMVKEYLTKARSEEGAK